MADGKIGNITKQTWISVRGDEHDPKSETGEALLFDTLETMYDAAHGHNNRLKKLERGRRVDMGIAAGTGLVGGFIAVLTRRLW